MRVCVLTVAVTGVPPAFAQNLKVAVATNFKTTAERLFAQFTDQTQIGVTLISGSTGKLYAQILQGAPYDIFLAADTVRPKALVDRGLATAQTTYACGQLVLIAHNGAQPTWQQFKHASTHHVAVAHPKLAPYGFAAVQALHHFDQIKDASFKLIRTDNVGQAFAVVQSGNAQLGLVALSLVQGTDTQYLPLPLSSHEPIAQDFVLLNRAQTNGRAQALVDFLRSDTGRTVIHASGYHDCSPREARE